MTRKTLKDAKEMLETLQAEMLDIPFEIKPIEVDGQLMFCLVDINGVIKNHEEIEVMFHTIRPFYKREDSHEIVYKKKMDHLRWKTTLGEKGKKAEWETFNQAYAKVVKIVDEKL